MRKWTYDGDRKSRNLGRAPSSRRICALILRSAEGASRRMVELAIVVAPLERPSRPLRGASGRGHGEGQAQGDKFSPPHDKKGRLAPPFSDRSGTSASALG